MKLLEFHEAEKKWTKDPRVLYALCDDCVALCVPSSTTHGTSRALLRRLRQREAGCSGPQALVAHLSIRSIFLTLHIHESANGLFDLTTACVLFIALFLSAGPTVVLRWESLSVTAPHPPPKKS